jgi:hypothetical protein
LTTVEVAVRRFLASQPTVTALVGQRIYQLILPQNPTLPAIRLQVISEPPNYHLRGKVDATRTRIQVDAYGSTTLVAGSTTDPYTVVNNVADAVDDVLVGNSGFTIDTVKVTAAFRVTRRAFFEAEELRVIRVSQDFDVWFSTVG